MNAKLEIRRISLIGLCSFASLFLTASLPILAQNSDDVTDVAGCAQITCLGGSDTLFAIPFTRPPALAATVSSVSGNVVTLANNPAMVSGQYVPGSSNGVADSFYIRLGPVQGIAGHSPLEGRWYMITANDATTLTLDLRGESLAGLTNGTPLSVIPCWTLNTLLPASEAGIWFTATTAPPTIKTQVLIPSSTTIGANFLPAATYYFVSAGANVGWRQYGGSSTVDCGNAPLLPSGYIVVRNMDGAPTTTISFSGSVTTGNLVASLSVSAGKKQNNPVGFLRPTDVTLNNLGLGPADGSFLASTSPTALSDQLQVYNNASVQLGKTPSSTYYYIKGGANVGWRLVGDQASVDHGNDIIPGGSALIVVKASASSAQTVHWINSQNF